jgi:hypothetical protein
MVKLIVGEKGSGKTKKLIARVNETAQVSKGNVICIEQGDSLRFDLDSNIRLIDINEYKVSGADAYYGFIAGLLAGNYDITEIFGDATFKILCGKDSKDQNALADFVERVAALVKEGPEVLFTVSCNANDIPERIRGFIA